MSLNELNKAMPSIKPELLKILCCPISKKSLVPKDRWLISTDQKTRRRYPIYNDIPALIENESEQLDEETWKNLTKGASI